MFSALLHLTSVIIFLSCEVLASQNGSVELSIIHVNDIHARYEQTSAASSVCKDESTCIGGFARVHHMMKQLESRPNAILINAGDNYQGSLYFNLFKWNITQQFMNMIPFDAYTLGNHEFDNGVDGVVPFITHLKAPVLVCNIDDSKEPAIQNTYQKSTVITRDGKKIGLIGVISKRTNEIADTEDLIFLDEVEYINKEAARMIEEDEDIFTIIVISHCGYDVDKGIAERVHDKVSLIVGAHSHSLLYNGQAPNGEVVEGPYPTVVKGESNSDVLIVQASCYTKYVGNFTMFLDDETGKVTEWEGSPIYLDNSIPQSQEVLDKLQPFKDEVDSFGGTVLGYTETDLLIDGCYTEECTMGNFVTDAMVAVWKDDEKKEPGAWAYVTLSTMNSGGLRAPILVGNITYNDIVNCQPFENTFDIGEIQGKYIKQFIEDGTKPYTTQRSGRGSDIYLSQLSGIKVVIDLTKPFGSRITKLDVLCQNCPEPVYEPIDEEKVYRMVVPSFLRKGGDNFISLSDNIKNVTIGPVDMDWYQKYIPQASPFNHTIEGRITIVGGERIPKMNWKM